MKTLQSLIFNFLSSLFNKIDLILSVFIEISKIYNCIKIV